MGTTVVLGGLFLAGLTFVAHRMNEPRIAGIAAGLSLVFILIILVFVVPPLARNASREASQLNLPFEMTLGGGIMIGLIAIVGFSAWNTGNNLLFLVFSFMTAAVVVGFIAGNTTLKRLDVKMRFPEAIFAGEETVVYVNVQNRKRLFSGYSVVADVRGTERSESAAADKLRKLLPGWMAERLARPPIIRRTLEYFVLVPPRSEAESRTLHIFERRGRFVIKDFEVSTKFPFAFFRHRRRLPAKETELIVLPRIEHIVPETSELHINNGKMVASRRGAGQELLSLRDYRFNDDIRRVDWKATARSGQVIVREFAAEDDRRVTIFFDPRVVEGRRSRLSLKLLLEAEQEGRDLLLSRRFERGIGLTAGVLKHFSDQQAETRLVIGGKIGEFGVGTRHLFESLRELATVEPESIKKDALVGIPLNVTELFDEAEDSYNFIVSSLKESSYGKGLLGRANFLRF